MGTAALRIRYLAVVGARRAGSPPRRLPTGPAHRLPVAPAGLLAPLAAIAKATISQNPDISSCVSRNQLPVIYCRRNHAIWRTQKMFISELRIENFRMFGEGSEEFLLSLEPGLTALVGENDNGKTAVIDALRLVLGTRDQESFRISPFREKQPNHFPRRFITNSKQTNFENRTESAESRALEINGPFGE
jgi:hypothetical protein